LVKFKLRNVKLDVFLELSTSMSLVYSIIPLKCFDSSVYFFIIVPSVIIREMNLKKNKCTKSIVISILYLHAQRYRT